MPSVYGRFADPDFLLSLQQDQLAAFFLGYFRCLPWRRREPVARCVARFVERFPQQLRPALSIALMDAWTWLEAEGFLRDDDCVKPAA